MLLLIWCWSRLYKRVTAILRMRPVSTLDFILHVSLSHGAITSDHIECSTMRPYRLLPSAPSPCAVLGLSTPDDGQTRHMVVALVAAVATDNRYPSKEDKSSYTATVYNRCEYTQRESFVRRFQSVLTHAMTVHIASGHSRSNGRSRSHMAHQPMCATRSPSRRRG